jgi:hypothetical protein
MFILKVSALYSILLVSEPLSEKQWVIGWTKVQTSDSTFRFHESSQQFHGEGNRNRPALVREVG